MAIVKFYELTKKDAALALDLIHRLMAIEGGYSDDSPVADLVLKLELHALRKSRREHLRRRAAGKPDHA